MAAHIRRRPFLAGIIAVLLVAVLLFGGRSAWRLVDRLLGPPPPPRQTDVSLIADWMSVPYIARVYRVPRTEMYVALGFGPDGPEGRDRRSLRELAQELGRTSDELVQIVRATVLEWQATHPEPPRPSPPPDAPPPPVLAPPKPDEPQPPSPIPVPAPSPAAPHEDISPARDLGQTNPRGWPHTNDQVAVQPPMASRACEGSHASVQGCVRSLLRRDDNWSVWDSETQTAQHQQTPAAQAFACSGGLRADPRVTISG